MESTHYIAKNLSELDTSNFEFFKSTDAIDFRVEITQKGVDKFYKENYPLMKLEMIDSRFYINGYYNQGEEGFITNHPVSYGKQILSISPEELKSNIINGVRGLDSYYLQMDQGST